MLLLTLSLLAQAPDTAVFATPDTRALVERAMARHAAGDTLVRDYGARFRYRLSFGIGRRRWARVPNAAVEEQEGTLEWTAPNDLRVEILGRRSDARSRELRLSSSFDRPWFVPRALGDSVRVFGNEVPRRAAIHPLAAEGPQWYHYRLTDSVQVTTATGRRLSLLAVEVLPRRGGLSLVAGRMWLDAAEADLVRFTFRFVGTALWVYPDEDTAGDSARARRENRLANRILTLDADLEYAQQEERYWMPYRQVVSGRVELPWFGQLVIPFQARTTFEDYTINQGRTIAFTVPLPPEVTDPDSIRALVRARRDSLRSERRERARRGEALPEDAPARDDAGRWPGGRYEIHRAPGDSLTAYAHWDDSLELDEDPVDQRAVRRFQSELERLAADLPRDLTGRPGTGIAWERLGELLRYNRVQGLAPGLGYRVALPGDGFTTIRGEARFGLSDERVTAGLALVREAPGARWTLEGYRDLRSSDPYSRANRLGNSFNALFVGHDDADYHLAHGARLIREGSLGTGLELRTELIVERQDRAPREAESRLNDWLGGTGRFPSNPGIREGTYVGGAWRLDGGTYRQRWSLGGDLMHGADRTTARIHGSLGVPVPVHRRPPQLSLKAGIATAPVLVPQQFRVGGGGTVRSFDYGARRGQAFWAAQLDWPLSRGLAQPVLFADAGQAGRARSLLSTPVLAGGGVGLSFLGGLVRFDLSHPFTDGGSGLRFDVSMRGLAWP